MSLALYRKYRPRTFAELVGQEHVTDALRQALLNDRVHHAYLFSGPRGCGKTSSARILARSLNCVQGPTPDPCGECDQCTGITAGTSLDVVEIDAASHGLVEDARDLRERAFFAPVSARFKVYVVDEAHMVTTQAFNALLKVVEEPPEYVKFVFATTEPEKVISTIRSRTHHYPFRLVPPKVLSAHLTRVCEAEGVTIDPKALPLVVRAGGGSVRDSMSVLDQLLAGAGPDGVTYELARSLLGVTDAALLDEIVDAFAARDGAGVFATVASVVDAGHDPRRFAGDLLERFRDLLLLQRIPDAAERGLLDCPPDAVPSLVRQSGAFGAAELSRAADLAYAGLTEMRGTTSPRLVLELVCARILLPGAATDEAAVLARVERLERRLDIAGTPPAAPAEPPRRAAPAPAPAPVAAAEPEPEPEPVAAAPAAEPAPAPASAEALDASAVRRVWPDVLDAVGRRKKATRARLSEAQVVGLADGTLTIEFLHDFHAKHVAQGENLEALTEALHEVLGVAWKVAATVRGGAAGEAAPVSYDPRDEGDLGAPDPAPDARPGEDAVALVQSALGARIVSEES